ncbi:hypothetical protein [Kibdelosporangium philippinense]|uniref:hypothetical protein n=1 Tax=Kibdelosporangium philippinense TaxID=211113 RepID=UPI00360860FB
MSLAKIKLVAEAQLSHLPRRSEATPHWYSSRRWDCTNFRFCPTFGVAMDSDRLRRGRVMSAGWPRRDGGG